MNAPNISDIHSLSKTTTSTTIAKTITPDHTYVFTAGIENLEKAITVNELSAYIKEFRAKNSDPSRFIEVYFKEEQIDHGGSWCIKYAHLSEDRGVRPSESVPLVAHGMTCAHPDHHNFIVDVSYSERAGGKEVNTELADIGEKFLRSLRFIPLPLNLASGRAEIRDAVEAMKTNNGERTLAILKPLLEKGDTQAAMLAGEIYASGYGNEKNFEALRQMYTIVASDGFDFALYNLGVMYDQAEGVQRDPAEAIKWFRLAADQRNHEAQMYLARYYYHGDGVPLNIEESDKWVYMAANNGNENAKKLIQIHEQR